MSLKRFIIEVGMGVDQHGQDNTHAAEKAVQDAISRSCLCGLKEVAGLKNPADMVVEVLIGCPDPQAVDQERVLKALPFGEKRIQVRRGGLLGKTLFQPELGDKTDEMVVANAIVTVYVP
ncbi:MAG: Lin0512 family protein [Deltaproteobacteria bacterium]|nr:Lin0512 family protein [Deltaproteobacteria bacterium]